MMDENETIEDLEAKRKATEIEMEYYCDYIKRKLNIKDEDE